MQESSIVKAYPAGYKEFEIGFALGLIDTPGGSPTYYQVTNKDSIPFVEKSDSSWWSSLSTSTTNAIGDVSNFLEPAENVLYELLFGVWSHPDQIDFKISIPAATELYGLKNSQTGRLNNQTSPIYAPTATVHCWGTSLIPNITLEHNGTSSFDANEGFIKFIVSGHKYELAAMDESPAVSHLINLLSITE